MAFLERTGPLCAMLRSVCWLVVNNVMGARNVIGGGFPGSTDKPPQSILLANARNCGNFRSKCDRFPGEAQGAERFGWQ